MKIAVVAPSPVPFTRGGAERALWGIQAAINDLTHHEAEMIKIPVDEHDLPSVLASYELFANLDLTHFDRIITTKYPAWMVDHPHKTILMMHTLRGVYDTYQYHHQPLTVTDPSDHVFALLHLMKTNPLNRGALPEFFERWHNALAALGADHPDFVFPGPFARLAIRWLDGIGMAPGAVQQYLSQSKTVALREGYFPTSVTPKIVNLPGHLPPAPHNDEQGTYLFTASRLDGPKRLDLLIDAMAYVPGDIELRIAGTGALRPQLEEQAAGDPRIRFLGFTRNDLLPELYANALAVPFIPADEDLGLITLEAFSQGTAVVTCTDSGGPTEFIKDGVTGLVAEPNPASIGAALAKLVADPDLAHAAWPGRQGARRTDHLGSGGRGPPRRRALHARGAGCPRRRPSPTPTHRHRRSSRRVVVLTTFPINDPGHGGQLRARNLYGSLARWRPVEVVALVDFGHQPDRQTLAPHLTQTVVPRSVDHHRLGEELSAEARMPVTDLVAGSHIELSPAYLQAVTEAAHGASALILAEPYLLPVVEHLGLDLPVIYDAYNVEATLKAGVYPDTELGRDLLRQVEEVEQRAVASVSQITTCSEARCRWRSARLPTRWPSGSPSLPTGPPSRTTCPPPTSGEPTAPAGASATGAPGASALSPSTSPCSSGRGTRRTSMPPSCSLEVAAEVPDVLILSVGRHGEAFARRTTPPNVVFAGTVSSRAKERLLLAADLALNPMRLGSGTNLKLLEYLASATPVVSTPFGARGIAVQDGEHLRFAEPEQFGSMMAEVLADPAGATQRAEAGRVLVRDRYGWDGLGKLLADVVTDIVPSEARK